MTLDINKIIQESVQDTIDNSKQDIETLEENTNLNTETLEESVSASMFQESYDPALASAISAGLGALNFRNHVRNINESSKLKKLKKVGAAGAAGTGATAGLAALGKREYDKSLTGRFGLGSDSIGSHIKRGAKTAGKVAADKFDDAKDKLGY